MIPISIQPYFVLIVVSIMFVLIYKEIVKPSISFLLAVMVLIITGILNSTEVLSGFSNEKIATIIVLILITSGIRKNYPIEYLFDSIFKAAKSYRGFLVRMMSQTALLSSFINNTPVVALMTPYVIDWGKKNNIAPSKLLIPLSYATIMGGMITIIGTSTTLVLNGFLEDYNLPIMKSSDLLIIGLSVAITGILFIAFIGQKLLPSHEDYLKQFSEKKREYVVETRVRKGSKLIGQNLTNAGLRNLKGVYLVEIIREQRVISPVSPSEVLEENDALIFAGDTEDIFELIDKNQGLDLPTTARELDSDKTQVNEAVLSPHSSIIGKTVKQCDFRNRYNAAIIAVHRNGERVRGKIGDIELQAGDLLMVYTGEDFQNRAEVYKDIYLISKLREINKPGNKKWYSLLLITLSIIILLFSGQLSLFLSLMIIIALMISFKLIKTQDIKRELDLNMIVILVFSLAIGKAIEKTGAGGIMATYMIEFLKPFGPVSMLIGIVILTNILTSIIGNVGAVSISFPIAYELSNQLGIEGFPFYLGLAYAASAAFMTPISYQTNLIVYGPGGYNFKDFFRIGFPVNLLYLLISLGAIIFLYRGELL